jgi:hypothetical protein
MAASGGSSIIRLRLNFMTAIYLPILLYAMSTYELEQGALVISERNLEAVAVPAQATLFAGDQFEATVLYRPVVPAGTLLDGEKGGVESLANPSITVDVQNSPEGLYYDEATRKFIFDTDGIFDGEPADVFEKQLTFRAVARIRSIVEDAEILKPMEQTFTVRRPVVNVISNAPPRLVTNSQNDLSFLVPGVGENEIILEESSRGLRVSGSRLTWSPRGDTTIVSIYRRLESGEQRLIDRRGFRVVPPPPPRVFIRRYQAGSAIPSADVIGINDDQLELVIQPDPSFARDYPRDANYRLGNMTLSYYQPGRPPQTLNIAAGSLPFDRQRSAATNEFIYGPFRLAQLSNQIRGNEVRLEIERVDRVNFEGTTERISNELFQDFFSLRTR